MMAAAFIKTEEILTIETPERVQLEFALASIGNRFLAVAIDHFIQYFSIFVLAWVFISIAGDGSLPAAPEQMFSDAPKWLIAISILVSFLIFASYFILFEWLWNGQTPGKRLMKLRVIRDDGRPITFWESAARNILRIADAAPGFLVPVYSVGLIVIFVSRRDQRVGDIFAGTVVIRERAEEAPTFSETFARRLTDAALTRVQKQVRFSADISPLTDREIEVVEAFLRRRWDLTDKQRSWMAWRIALPIMYRLKPGYSMDDFTYEGFLEELLHRFRAAEKFLN